jgi:cytochrome c oxidase assembly protein subunit 15
VLVQIGLGGWVSSNYAVMACPDFPLCQGELFPPMDFASGFTWWRALGLTSDGEPIAIQALVAIHWTHRMFAIVVTAVVGVLIWQLWRSGLSRLAQGLAALLVVQLVTGLSNVVLQWPLLLAVLHSGGAALLVAVIVVALHRTASRSLDLHVTQVAA